MSNINFAQITVQGRLTDDPEMVSTKTGTTMCKFRVAVNRRINKDNEKTSFIPVTVFGKEAVNCGEYLTKGRSVMVSGEFETDQYTDRDGNNRTGFGVIAQKVIFGSGGRSNEDAPGQERSSYGPSKGKGQAQTYLNKNSGRGYDRNR